MQVQAVCNRKLPVEYRTIASFCPDTHQTSIEAFLEKAPFGINLQDLRYNLCVFSQESQTSYSSESEQDWLLSRHHQLKAVAAVLTPAHERLLQAIETRNISDFV